MNQKILQRLERFENVIIVALIGLMVLVVGLSTVELAVVLGRDILYSPWHLPGITELLEIFGMFLLVLLGLELLEVIKAYLVEHAIHVEIVMVVALIAIARKVIILDLKSTQAMMLLAIGVIILTLSIGYYLIAKVHQGRHPPKS